VLFFVRETATVLETEIDGDVLLVAEGVKLRCVTVVLRVAVAESDRDDAVTEAVGDGAVRLPLWLFEDDGVSVFDADAFFVADGAAAIDTGGFVYSPVIPTFDDDAHVLDTPGMLKIVGPT
jgi:hypothetical protein